MKSRISIVMIAIAAFIASESAANAQGPAYPGQPGFADPSGFAQPPIAYPQVAPGSLPPGGQFGEFAGGAEACDVGSLVDPPYPWRYWGNADALLWWRNGGSSPVLFTTSPAPTTPLQINNVPNATVLGVATTDVLFGGNQIFDGPGFGGNVLAGMWFDELREVGLAVRGFALSRDARGFNAFSDPTAGGPDIGRPFFNTATGQQDALPIAFVGPNNPPADPTVVSLRVGSVSANASNCVYGAETYFRVNWDRAPGYSLDVIGGYMYTRIDDQLAAGHDFVDIDPTNLIPDGTRFQANDSFNARNDFHGATMGLTGELQSGRFTARMLGKVAFGSMNQSVITAGDSAITIPGFLPVNSANGFFNAAGNSGTFIRSQFCVVPEANITGGYQLTDNVNLSVGYNFIYWTRVALAGNQVPTDLAGVGGAPPFAIRNGDFWVQGLNLGVSVRF